MFDSLLGLAYFFVVGSNIVLAIFTLYVGRSNRVNISFSMISFLLALWVISSYFAVSYFQSYRDIASFWFRMRYLTIIPIPALFLYFAGIFPEYKGTDTGFRKDIWIFAPLPFLSILQLSGLVAQSVMPSNT